MSVFSKKATKERTMFKKGLSIAMAVSILHLTWAAPSFGSPKSSKEAQFIEKVQARVFSLGTGETALVQVQLRDKTSLQGYISAASQESFTVTNPETGASTQVAYPKVKGVKGHNLSKSTKISIGVLVGIAFLVAILIGIHLDDN